jgi:hypothetical protein
MDYHGYIALVLRAYVSQIPADDDMLQMNFTSSSLSRPVHLLVSYTLKCIDVPAPDNLTSLMLDTRSYYPTQDWFVQRLLGFHYHVNWHGRSRDTHERVLDPERCNHFYKYWPLVVFSSHLSPSH